MFQSSVSQGFQGENMEDRSMHSEAIWGVMIALVFFAIFEPYDENKS